jgi:hypothetical protein
MYKHTVTYTDYNGNEQTEDLYFNLSKAEVAEMQLTYPQGLDKYVESIMGDEDKGIEANIPEMTRFFKELMLKSYGVKSEDGRRFIKNDKLREEFLQTEAYSEMFYALLTDENTMTTFVKNVMPKNLGEPEKKDVTSLA